MVGGAVFAWGSGSGEGSFMSSFHGGQEQEALGGGRVQSSASSIKRVHSPQWRVGRPRPVDCI